MMVVSTAIVGQTSQPFHLYLGLSMYRLVALEVRVRIFLRAFVNFIILDSLFVQDSKPGM
jgi:hypothetical protein